MPLWLKILLGIGGTSLVTLGLYAALGDDSDNPMGSDGTLDAATKRKIWNIVAVFESRQDYGAVNENEVTGGISYGVLQASSAVGSLQGLLNYYAQLGGKYAQELQRFGDSSNPNVARNREFIATLKLAGKDPIMHQAQMNFFGQQYFEPAMEFGKSLNLQSPVSYLVLFDASIHYGLPEPDKQWVRDKIAGYIRQRGELPGIGEWCLWMEQNLRNSYTKRYGADNIHTRYNVWRATFLRGLVQSNPLLQGPIEIRFDAWGSPSTVQGSPYVWYTPVPGYRIYQNGATEVFDCSRQCLNMQPYATMG